MDPKELRCETCDFCNPAREICVFQPPTVIADGSSKWPAVSPKNDRCAMHSAIDAEACGCDLDEEDDE